MTNTGTLLSFNNVTARLGEKVLFSGFSFAVHKGNHWAVLGPAGSGKSALLELIAGNLNIVNGKVLRPFYEEYLTTNQPADPYFSYRQLVGYLPAKYQFRNLSNTTDFFYQQRFNAAFSDDAPTVAAYLKETAQLYSYPGPWTFEKVIALFQLNQLLGKQLIKLSNGETKRLRLASVLLKNPLILLLDNPLVGLDVQTRANFDGILGQVATSGITIIMATQPGEIPAIITHAAILDDCQLKTVVEKKDFSSIRIAPSKEVNISPRLGRLLSGAKTPSFRYILRMKKVQVRYGHHLILDNINWEIKPGERWALRGPNGAGKSTLLSLINGDNPQAYANDIEIFDRKRGTGESIWDLKRRIGYVSPELLQYFHTSSSCRHVVASGFNDSMGVAGTLNDAQTGLIADCMQELDIGPYSEELFLHVPPTIQRLCLILRALIKNPPLLILDEPCQGLDSAQQKRVRALLDNICEATATTLIYVTHYEEELPTCITHTFRLDAGKSA